MIRLRHLLALASIFVSLSMPIAQELTPTATVDNIVIDTGLSPVNVYFKTDTLETHLGEPFEVDLIAELPQGFTIPVWNEAPLDEPFEIIDSTEVETTTQGNLTIEKQALTVVVWEFGNQTTPEVFMTYISPAGISQRTPITSISIAVQATLADGDLNLRPLKPLIDLPYLPPIVFLIPIILILIIVWVIRNIAYSRRIRRAFAIPDSPMQRAIIDLKHLLDANIEAQTAYPLIADEIRTYLTQEFDIRATDLTTKELMKILGSAHIFADSLAYGLEHLLTQADLVKFANHVPLNSTSEIVEFAIHWIEEAEKTRIAHE